MEEEKHNSHPHDKRKLAPSEVVWHVSALADLLQIAGSPDCDNATLERWQAKLPALHVNDEDVDEDEDLTDDDGIDDGDRLNDSNVSTDALALELEQVIAQLEGLQQYDQEYDQDHHNPVLDDYNVVPTTTTTKSTRLKNASRKKKDKDRTLSSPQRQPPSMSSTPIMTMT
eukprot:scaffold31036_cov42-Attheya_sp.AAC.1